MENSILINQIFYAISSNGKFHPKKKFQWKNDASNRHDKKWYSLELENKERKSVLVCGSNSIIHQKCWSNSKTKFKRKFKTVQRNFHLMKVISWSFCIISFYCLEIVVPVQKNNGVLENWKKIFYANGLDMRTPWSKLSHMISTYKKSWAVRSKHHSKTYVTLRSSKWRALFLRVSRQCFSRWYNPEPSWPFIRALSLSLFYR